jgi:hypothetical protein
MATNYRLVGLPSFIVSGRVPCVLHQPIENTGAGVGGCKLAVPFYDSAPRFFQTENRFGNLACLRQFPGGGINQIGKFGTN